MNIGIKFIALVLSIYIIGLIYNGFFHSHQNLTYLTTNFIIFLLIISILIHAGIKDINKNKSIIEFGWDLLILTLLIIILICHIIKYKYHFNLIKQKQNKLTITINQI